MNFLLSLTKTGIKQFFFISDKTVLLDFTTFLIRNYLIDLLLVSYYLIANIAIDAEESFSIGYVVINIEKIHELIVLRAQFIQMILNDPHLILHS